MDNKIDLKHLLNVDEIKQLFEGYSLTSGFDVSLYDIEGKECFFVRKKHCICNYVNRKNYCEKMIVYSGNKASELKEPYIFETSCGLVMCIVPVILEEETIGYISCGPVILWDKDDFFKDEIRKKWIDMGIEPNDEIISSIKKVECNVMTGSAKMLAILVNYLVQESSKFMASRQAYEKLKLQHLKTKKELDIYERQTNFKKYPIEREKELLAYVQLGEKEKARGIINIFLDEIFSYASGDMEIIKAKLYEFTAFLSRTAVESGAPLSDLKDIVKQSSRIFLENIDFPDLCYTTIKIMEMYIDVVYRSKKATSVHLAKAIEYINTYYFEQITLNSVSKSIYVSSYYLSHLFREGINMTFSDYLNKVRTDKAKIFLLEGLKVEETCEKVGYNDVNYFNKTFKKYVGVSPAKYRRAINYDE